MSDRLIVSTRKGLFHVARSRGAWTIAGADFLGDNVSLALEIAQPELSLAKARERSAAALAAVGLGDRMHHRPTAMSGGEQQRVGLARAIIAVPKLLLADEPTGNLDQNTGAQVIRLMFDLARQQGAAVVFVTHDPALAARADRVLTMTRGELTEDRK